MDYIESFIGNTRVLAVKGPLLKDGKPVEAKNYPTKNLIEIDKEKFKKTHTRRLMIHEVLGLAKLEDSSYALSRELEKEYNVLFSGKRFPLDTVYQQAHQAWAQSDFSSLSEAVDFINSKRFSCSWISWVSSWLGDADPNQWLTRQDVVPLAQFKQTPLGQIVSIGMNTNFEGSSPGPAVLRNGKVETVIHFYDGSVSKAIAGKSGDRLFIKLRDFRSEYSTDFENINVCQ